MNKLILKFIWKCIHSGKNKTIWKKKSKVEGLILDLKAYYKISERIEIID